MIACSSGAIRRTTAFAVLGLTVALAAACTRARAPATGVDLSYHLTPDPPSVGPAVLSFTVRNSAGAPMTGLAAKVVTAMSHPGMATVATTAVERSPGEYEARVELIMAGDWTLTVTAPLPDGSQLERRIDVPRVVAR